MALPQWEQQPSAPPLTAAMATTTTAAISTPMDTVFAQTNTDEPQLWASAAAATKQKMTRGPLLPPLVRMRPRVHQHGAVIRYQIGRRLPPDPGARYPLS